MRAWSSTSWLLQSSQAGQAQHLWLRSESRTGHEQSPSSNSRLLRAELCNQAVEQSLGHGNLRATCHTRGRWSQGMPWLLQNAPKYLRHLPEGEIKYNDHPSSVFTLRRWGKLSAQSLLLSAAFCLEAEKAFAE